ncbi:MAG: class I SAM-dependent methyltransferase [Deltaproteobacteria bacterium]|nr:class I SAM-dependent methyltransferase [Deltaproteobacteria bacterium]
MSWWSETVVPRLIEKACRSAEILEERERWVPRAHGRVLELGVGSGLNLAFYDPTRVEQVVGIDPSAALLARAAARVKDAKVPVELQQARAEALPFADASFDSALVTYSLCSVDDLSRAVAEVRRVVKPAGELVFVEHGRAPDRGPQRWQRRLTPVWRRVGGGCRLDRDVVGALRAGGWAVDDLREGYTKGPRWLSYTYEGTATAS